MKCIPLTISALTITNRATRAGISSCSLASALHRIQSIPACCALSFSPYHDLVPVDDVAVPIAVVPTDAVDVADAIDAVDAVLAVYTVAAEYTAAAMYTAIAEYIAAAVYTTAAVYTAAAFPPACVEAFATSVAASTSSAPLVRPSAFVLVLTSASVPALAQLEPVVAIPSKINATIG